MVLRHLHYGVPKAYVAAEFRVYRPTVTTWVVRYLESDQDGLVDRSPPPRTTAAPAPGTCREAHRVLPAGTEVVSPAHRPPPSGPGARAFPAHRGPIGGGQEISRLRDLAPDGNDLRRPPRRIRAPLPGHMAHLDVRTIGKIPDGGGWRAHGRGSNAAKAAKRGPWEKVGYTYLHSAVDGFSRWAYTEALDDEKAVMTIGFFCRARAFFAAHGSTQLHRAVTDNSANYRAMDFTRYVEALTGRHQRIKSYTPRHNGNVERYNRLLADEVLHVRLYATEQARREAIGVWVDHFNYHRPHTASGDQPPASRVPVKSITSCPVTASRRLPKSSQNGKNGRATGNK